MNSNKIIGISVVIILIGVGLYFISTKNNGQAIPSSDISVNQLVSSAKNATYKINGLPITLKNGVSEVPTVPGSASKIITRYFGNEVIHDFNGDGREDIAFLLTQENGGSGTFYYVVAALSTVNGYVGSQGLLLGDRIAPQTTEISSNPNQKDVIVVNYAERKPGEPMTAEPSVGKSIWLKLDPVTMQFGEVAQNFEGEADPGRMTLGMKTWAWVSTTYNNNAEVKPRVEKKFTITFKDNKTFSATTDCNNVGGEYAVTGNKISFDKMFSTKMYCENSQENDFTKMLGEAQSFLFTSKGELILSLKLDSGSIIFN